MIKRIMCVASGPSLTEEDYLLLASKSDLVISANNSMFSSRPPNIVYGFDPIWWEYNYDNIPSTCSKYSHLPVENHPDVKQFFYLNSCYNSGAQAIFLASVFAPKEIVLLGYDCDISEGSHFHGDHIGKLTNPDLETVAKWMEDYYLVKKYLPDSIAVINCTRRTKITCFERLSIEDLL